MRSSSAGTAAVSIVTHADRQREPRGFHRGSMILDPSARGSRRGEGKLTPIPRTLIVSRHGATPTRRYSVRDDRRPGLRGRGRRAGRWLRGVRAGRRARGHLRVRLVQARSRFGRGVIEAVEEPSPHRVEAPCPYFGRCGGCRLQHLAYPAQLAFKTKQVVDCLERLGGLGASRCGPSSPPPRRTATGTRWSSRWRAPGRRAGDPVGRRSTDRDGGASSSASTRRIATTPCSTSTAACCSPTA